MTLMYFAIESRNCVYCVGFVFGHVHFALCEVYEVVSVN